MEQTRRAARPMGMAPLPPSFEAPPKIYVIAAFAHSAQNPTELSIAPRDKLEVTIVVITLLIYLTY
jgi:hypothetical protein